MTIRVYAAGVFDLFHVGHLNFIKRAARMGNHLTVGVHSDEDAESYKRKPIIPFAERCAIISSLGMVDSVIEGPVVTTDALYDRYNIDLHVQGRNELDYAYVDGLARGMVQFIGRDETTSSSEIIDRILKRHDQ